MFLVINLIIQLVQSQNPSSCNLDVSLASARVDCGYAGITESLCNQKNCCWGALPFGVNGAWCFKPLNPNPPQCPSNPPGSSRIDCGFPGITIDTCQSKGCCWSPTTQGPWCFNPTSNPNPYPNQSFVTRSGSILMEGSNRFRFISLNVPNLFMLEDKMTFQGKKVYLMPDPWEQEDASLTIAGFNGRVMRTYTLGMGPNQHITGLRQYNEAAFLALDNAVAASKKYNNRLILPLINENNGLGYYGDYGTMASYRGLSPSVFYTHPDLIADMKDFISFLLNRVNTVTRIAYKDEPAILAWQLGNELGSWTKSPAPDSWKFAIASHIKSLAPRALVMDSTIGGASRMTIASLNSPLIDIFTNHYYGSSSSDIISDAKYVASFNKVFINGEFGFADVNWYNAVMNNCLKTSECTGALIWSLRYHSIDGGFYIHNEFGQYSSYHAPGFTDPSNGFSNEEKSTVTAVRNYALQIQYGNSNAPYPTPPNPGIVTGTLSSTALKWRGSAWASGYNLERMYGNSGQWVRIANNVQEGVKFGSTLYSDSDADATQDISYRVQAVGVTNALSGWTVLGRIPGTSPPGGGTCNFNKPGSARVDSGYYGITQQQCEAKGACFGPPPDGSGPWCFAKDTAPPSSCTPVKTGNQRTDCGFYGITQAICLSKGCCWAPSTNGPWCYL